ncbi:MAG: 3'(2'),5'-bisphosphate nucleotidase CysQ [bacterium]
MTLPHEMLSNWLDACRQIARDAGEEILDVYAGEFDVNHKQDNSPVTTADLRANTLICDRLSKLTPELPILTEENKPASYSERKHWETYWLIDPLDGTREFVKRNGEFTVNIALIHQHESILGVVDAPAMRLQFSGGRGQGVWKQEYDQPLTPINARELREENFKVATTRSHGNERLRQFKRNLPPHEEITTGSSLKICLIAQGAADLYPRIGPTSEWDTAAAHAILEAAGGNLTDTSMQPLRYNTKESLLNPEFFAFGTTHFDWSCYLP